VFTRKGDLRLPDWSCGETQPGQKKLNLKRKEAMAPNPTQVDVNDVNEVNVMAQGANTEIFGSQEYAR
jgi:hypothetical protein